MEFNIKVTNFYLTEILTNYSNWETTTKKIKTVEYISQDIL